MTLVNQMGHALGANENVILKPVKTVVKRRGKGAKPRIRVTSGMRMREFHKVKEDGTTVAYTPKQPNKNPAFASCFHIGVYRSPTGVLLPKSIREKKDDQ